MDIPIPEENAVSRRNIVQEIDRQVGCSPECQHECIKCFSPLSPKLHHRIWDDENADAKRKGFNGMSLRIPDLSFLESSNLEPRRPLMLVQPTLWRLDYACEFIKANFTPAHGDLSNQSTHVFRKRVTSKAPHIPFLRGCRSCYLTWRITQKTSIFGRQRTTFRNLSQSVNTSCLREPDTLSISNRLWITAGQLGVSWYI
ncbi:hypothetical protein GGI42DRAFT_117374 [Trichoderma sp. SZMC 28013]